VEAVKPTGASAEMVRRDVAADFPEGGSAALRLLKSDHVRSVFENAPRYLNSRQVDIRVRAETVKGFAAKVEWHRLLDIGCGDGTISLPLLAPANHLTLLDLSGNMAALTQGKIPEDLAGNVEVRNENFMTASFVPASFDLIVSVGVMAHVDSPEEFIAKITTLLRPGGSLILEFTDCRHFVGRMGRLLGQLQEFVAPAKYRTNKLSFPEVARILKNYRLQLTSVFRYATIPIPRIERLLNHGAQYKMVERVFGKCTDNRTSWLGNEYICLLTFDEATSAVHRSNA
jgi:SAM-dependent methyltransferase